ERSAEHLETPRERYLRWKISTGDPVYRWARSLASDLRRWPQHGFRTGFPHLEARNRKWQRRAGGNRTPRRSRRSHGSACFARWTVSAAWGFSRWQERRLRQARRSVRRVRQGRRRRRAADANRSPRVAPRVGVRQPPPGVRFAAQRKEPNFSVRLR